MNHEWNKTNQKLKVKKPKNNKNQKTITTKQIKTKYTNKNKNSVQRDGDHGVTVIGSSVQNREGVVFFKVLSDDVAFGQSVSGGLASGRGHGSYIYHQINFLLSGGKTRVGHRHS